MPREIIQIRWLSMLGNWYRGYFQTPGITALLLSRTARLLPAPVDFQIVALKLGWSSSPYQLALISIERYRGHYLVVMYNPAQKS